MLKTKASFKIDNLKVKPIGSWEKIAWPSKQIQAMYCDWGDYFRKKERLSNAYTYCSKSLDYGVNERSLYPMSNCKRFLAEPENALKDAKLATLLNPTVPNDIEVLKCLHESNKTIDAIVYANQCIEKYSDKRTPLFQTYLDVFHSTIDDSLGETLTPFINKNHHLITKAYDFYENKKLRAEDQRPLWKILKADDHCDVASIIEDEVKLMSPLEIARHDRDFNILNQIYFGRNFKDIGFLRSLFENPNFLLKQAPESSEKLKNYLCSKYRIVLMYRKMLRGHTPTYYHKAKQYNDKKAYIKNREEYLYRLQYQTRRSAMIILKHLKRLRNDGEIQKMINYIEQIMSKYIAIKTFRVLPWKFEFINEVYNLLSRTIMECIDIPQKFVQYKQKQKLMKLFNMSSAKDVKVFEFGKPSTYTNIYTVEKYLEKHKTFMTNCENRISFAKYPIELTYLYYIMAQKNLEQRYYSEAITLSMLGITHAEKCHNLPWEFLNTLTVVKTHVLLDKTEYIKVWIDKAKRIADKLNNKKLQTYIDLCQAINLKDIETKSRSNLIENISIRLRRSRQSHLSPSASMTSIDSFILNTTIDEEKLSDNDS